MGLLVFCGRLMFPFPEVCIPGMVVDYYCDSLFLVVNILFMRHNRCSEYYFYLCINCFLFLFVASSQLSVLLILASLPSFLHFYMISCVFVSYVIST